MTYIDSPEFHDPAAHVVAYIEWRRAKVRQMAEANVRLVYSMVKKWVKRIVVVVYGSLLLFLAKRLDSTTPPVHHVLYLPLSERLIT